MSNSAIERLKAERKAYRKERLQGFSAKPISTANGELNFMKWICKIPGPPGPWSEGMYTLYLNFPDNYPTNPPKAVFTPPLFHPNVYDDGEVCLSLLSAEKDWKPTISIGTILRNLQTFLNNPNNSDAANAPAFVLYGRSIKEYNERVKKEAKKFRPLE